MWHELASCVEYKKLVSATSFYKLEFLNHKWWEIYFVLDFFFKSYTCGIRKIQYTRHQSSNDSSINCTFIVKDWCTLVQFENEASTNICFSSSTFDLMLLLTYLLVPGNMIWCWCLCCNIIWEDVLWHCFAFQDPGKQ